MFHCDSWRHSPLWPARGCRRLGLVLCVGEATHGAGYGDSAGCLGSHDKVGRKLG